MRRLKHFEHGKSFITLDSDNGNYIVSLYVDNVLVNTFESTTLDASNEMYHLTCKHAQVVELP